MIHKIPWFWDVQIGVSDSLVTDGWVGPIGIRLRSVVQWRAILLNLHYQLLNSGQREMGEEEVVRGWPTNARTLW